MSEGKRKAKSSEAKKSVQIVEKPGEDRAALLAQTYLRPTVQNAATVRAFNAGKDDSGPALMALIEELGKQVAAVNDGDMKRAEGMLVAQAHTLDAIFGSLARRAVNQDYLKQYETYMRLALKAQSQCRATLQALAEIKNPRPVAFVQQANISNGPQQVNNGSALQPGRLRARENENEQNKLLEREHAERLDDATTGPAGLVNSPVEAVATCHGTTDRCR